MLRFWKRCSLFFKAFERSPKVTDHQYVGKYLGDETHYRKTSLYKLNIVRNYRSHCYYWKRSIRVQTVIIVMFGPFSEQEIGL